MNDMVDELYIYTKRRQRLFDRMPEDSVLILRSGEELLRNGDVHYQFRPNSDFYYLTGFKEQDAYLVMRKLRHDTETIIFCMPKNYDKEIWTGEVLGEAGALTNLGCDEAYSVETIASKMPKLLQNIVTVIYPYGQDRTLEKQIRGWIKNIHTKSRKGIQAPQQFIAASEFLHEMRLIKSEEELNIMKQAAIISAAAHKAAMKACKPDMKEYELDAVLRFNMMSQGCQDVAYPSIVGGGKNACILHYIKNTDRLKSGDLVLIDAGGEFDMYASDITRTFPVNGTFSDAQRALYEVVLKAQLAAIDTVKPGALFEDAQDATVRVITEGLLDLGFLSGSTEELIDGGDYKKFYMHSSGHWIGLDVHDVGYYKKDDVSRTLAPGMVLTVEPGIYISPSCGSVPPQWRGIGIRIEDVVLVTKTGHEVLSKAVPKTVDEIEQLMQSS